MNKHAVAWIKGLIQYGIGFGLLAYVISKYWADSPTGAPGLQTLLNGPIRYEWLLAATAFTAAALCMHMFRWYILVRALDLPFTLRNAFRLGMVGLFYNTFLPGSVGGDLVKAFFLAKEHPERRTRAVATVIADRLMGLFGLILFVGLIGSVVWQLGDPIIGSNVDLQWIVKTMAAIAAGSICVFLLLGLLPRGRADRFISRLKSIPKVGGSLAELWFAVWMYRQRLGSVALGIGVTALSHVALVSAIHCASRVFPPENPTTDLMSWPEHAVIAPIGFIVQAIPLSPGGIGVGEAAFAGLYKLSGRPESRGFIARLSLRIAEWLLAFMGYIIYLRMKAHHELPEEATNDDANATPATPATPEPAS